MENVEITLINLSSIPCIIKKIDKIFCGCQIVFSNSTVLSNTGSALLASIANKARKPFYIVSMICSFT